jgi:hypothetical protein
MADIERSIYFYNVDPDDGEEWKRADVLRALDALRGEDRLLSLGNDNYAWVKVDHIPRGREHGRARFFRDRRSNLPGWALDGTINELDIPERAGLVEPTHIVFAGDGLLAAEYNHFAPRITSAFAQLLRQKLAMGLRIGTYVQGDIIEQLDRLTYIQYLELSVVPTPELEAEMRNAGTFGRAAAELASVDGGRRAHLQLSGDKRSHSWTDEARGFVKRVANMGAKDETKILRVEGFDPATGGVEVVDLLKQKLVRHVDMPRSQQRSRVLNISSAYRYIEDSIREARQNDLPHAAVVY